MSDSIFRAIFAGAGWLVLILLVGVAASMLWGGREAFSTFGWHFLIDSDWDAVNHKFGALVPIYGTLVTALIAMLIAVPVSFGIALFLTEVAPNWLRGPIAAAIELLAGIPSIIYGMWGLFVFVPFMAAHVIPFLNAHLGQWPIIGPLFRGPPLGIGMLTAGIVLAIMVIPFISAVMRDVFLSVPTRLKESAYALGSTTWEVAWDVVLPYTRTAVIGGVFLGLGRALGETMAVTFVLGNAHMLVAVAADAGQFDRRHTRQRIHRSRFGPVPLIADRARLPAVRRHLHRARHRQVDAHAPGAQGRQLTWRRWKRCTRDAASGTRSH